MGEPVNLGPGGQQPNKDNSLMVLPQGGVAMFATTKGRGTRFLASGIAFGGTPIEVVPLRGMVRDANTGEKH